MENNTNTPDGYKFIKLLGQGSYGKAYLVECLSDNVYFKYILKHFLFTRKNMLLNPFQLIKCPNKKEKKPDKKLKF